MGLNLEEKKAVVAEVSAEVAKAQAIVVAEYRGLEVGHMTDLRKRARKSGVYLRVLKNTLARRAVAETPFAGLAEKMVGPLAYGISSDPVAVAKVLNEFAKGNEKFVIKGGAMANWSCPRRRSASLASMPSREELLAKLLGNDAGAGRQVRADVERGAVALRAHAGGGSRPRESRLPDPQPASSPNNVTLTIQETEMAVAKAEILDAISNMTVLELSQLIKDMEEKFGVSAAAAAVAVAAPAAGGALPRLRKSRPNSPSC